MATPLDSERKSHDRRRPNRVLCLPVLRILEFSLRNCQRERTLQMQEVQEGIRQADDESGVREKGKQVNFYRPRGRVFSPAVASKSGGRETLRGLI